MKLGTPIETKKGLYRGFFVEQDRYGKKDTFCCYISWDGDGIYTDLKRDQFITIPISDLNSSMQESRKKFLGAKERKAVDHKPLQFTLGDLSLAWDQALAGTTVGKDKVPVARSFESYSYRALVDALEKQKGRKK